MESFTGLCLGPILPQQSDAVARLSANGGAAFFCSFQRKLCLHWLKFLRQRHVTVVRQGPAPHLHVADFGSGHPVIFAETSCPVL